MTLSACARPARANSITLSFDQNLMAEQDSRPGREDVSLYRVITTLFVLRIDTFEEDFQVTGAARFFLVRGDAAMIPEELAARGVGPDAGRWYIQRWEDESVGDPAPKARAQDTPGAEPHRTLPASNRTWCSVKALYR